MIVMENIHSIRVTDAEVEILDRALNDLYKAAKEEKSNCKDEKRKQAIEYTDRVRTLRNEFAHIIGKTYMGADA